MELDNRLSKIETLWSVVRSAHGQDRERVSRAQQRLIDQYGGAVRRYLGGALKNDELADELYQEFAVALVNGEFQNADPLQGRFRNYLKTILFRMIALHYRRTKKSPRMLDVNDVADSYTNGSSTIDDQKFTESWREELLALTWDALENLEETTGKPLYSVLRLKLDNPSANSEQLAELLGKRTGRTISSTNVRVILHRAREAFADSLLDTVAQSLDATSADMLEQELADLELLEYCRPAIERRRPS